KMIDIFEEENLRGNRSEMTETIEFVNKQLAERQSELEKAEQRRLAFEAEHPEMIQGGAVAVRRLETARSQLRSLEADLAAAQSALAAINGQLAGTPKTIPGGAAGSAGASLSRALGDLAAMRARGLTENHPDVISVKNQVASLKAAAERETSNNLGMPNPAYTSLLSIKAERGANVQALQSRIAGARSDVAEMSAMQISNPALAEETHRINRDYNVLRQQYDELLRDREELRLRGEIKTEREAVKFQVVDPPTTPRSPVAPQRPLLLIGVLIVGIAAGCAAAFGLSKLRSTFSTSASLERGIDLPVLGTISAMLTEAGRATRKRELKFFYGASGALGGLFLVLVAAEFVQRGTVA
ncbi:MAG: GNVR domain-containing protein, partial [Novosphingobium sp.]|nr:GNVR domain-containing protein [Novosphingobium sp.]